MTTIAIMLMIPFIARNEGFTILIMGKLKIPARIAIKPMMTVVKWVMLFEVIPRFSDFNFLTFASSINPTPMINIKKDSEYSDGSNSKKLEMIIPKKPIMLTTASAVTNFCETRTVPENLFFIIYKKGFGI